MQKTKWLLAVLIAVQCLSTLGTCGALAAGEVPQNQADDKSDLKILFVGQDPENPVIVFADASDKRQQTLYKERTGAFEKFLSERFNNVKIVFGADYTAEMSDSFDVTVFDSRPKALTEAVRDDDDYTPPTYLPLDFDRPALLISENSPLIGEGIGLKLDWL